MGINLCPQDTKLEFEFSLLNWACGRLSALESNLVNDMGYSITVSHVDSKCIGNFTYTHVEYFFISFSSERFINTVNASQGFSLEQSMLYHSSKLVTTLIKVAQLSILLKL